MGILAKLTPSKSKPAIFDTKKSESKKPLLPNQFPALATEDEVTFYTVFMLIYYGFFGLTLLYPYVHAADGPFTNPLAYWTTMTPTMASIFRILACAFLTIVLGPFFDEIFGGTGVSMKAFARQTCMLNILTFFLFVYYGYYAPVPMEVVFVWKCQGAFGGFLVGWSLLEVFETPSLADFYKAFMSLEFAFFSLTLATFPALFYGPGSPVAYWKTWTDFGLCTGRSLGMTMGVAFILGYVYYSKTPGYCKMLTLWNVAIVALMCIPAYYGGSSSVETMWEIQIVVQIPLLVIGLYLEIVGATGGNTINFGCPTWDGKVESFNFFNFLFNIGFAIGFLYDPNAIFGPNNILGGPALFAVQADETAVWFGKAWALATMMIILGPYLFGLPANKVAKQMVLVYLFNVGIFGYTLYYLSVFNFSFAAPMCGLQVLLVGWGLYASLNSGEDLLMA
jgi:hypothetical protein